MRSCISYRKFIAYIYLFFFIYNDIFYYKLSIYKYKRGAVQTQKHKFKKFCFIREKKIKLGITYILNYEIIINL